MITAFRWILLPITLVYFSIIWIRNLFYDKSILKSTKFEIPTIVIGNLAIGGTGKSPLTEYIVRLLKDNYKIATLSRGYGRKTKGYRIVNAHSLANEVGDEPLQFKSKFPEITVAVSENRCFGIEKLQEYHDVIILDDAYQHRKLTPGLSILLFDFKSLYAPILPLPTGNFRDNFSAAKRAHLIMITKCPDTLNQDHKKYIEDKIRKVSLAPIYYAGIAYDIPRNRKNILIDKELKKLNILLFCGIANPIPLKNYLTELGNTIHLLEFPDHHNYTDNDFKKIVKRFESIPVSEKIIITTEKDMQRIQSDKLSELPLYYIPIRLKSMDIEFPKFDQSIFDYVKSNVKKA